MKAKETQEQKGQASEKEGVSEEQAVETDAAKQTSDDEGITSPKDAADELTKIFAVPGRPGLKLTGGELANAVGRAELAQKFQGDADKATEKAEAAEERALQAEAKLKALEDDRQLIEKLENAGLLGVKPSASERSTDDWLEETPADSKLEAKEVARIVEETTRQMADTRFSNLDTKVQEAVLSELQKTRGEEQQLKQYERFMEAEARASRAALRIDYPSVSDDSIEEMALLLERANSSWTDAQKAAVAGDPVTAEAKVGERNA